MSHALAICIFALSMSITPGPVNIISLSAGANNGFVRTLPFITGATIGFIALLFLFGLGAIELLALYPSAMKTAGYIGCAFIFYMAFKTLTSQATIKIQAIKTPQFHEGILLQWLNPKAWMACMSGIAAFTTKGDQSSLILFCTLYFFMCYCGVSFWAVLGSKTQKFIQTDKQKKLFNTLMSVSLGLVAIYLCVDLTLQ